MYLRPLVRTAACRRKIVDQHTTITTIIIIAAAGVDAEAGEVW